MDESVSDLCVLNKALENEIAEPRLAEEKLLQSEARLQRALDTASIGIWELDVETDLIVSYGHHDRILGYGPGEFDGTLSGFQNRVHGDDFEGLEKAVLWARDQRTEYHHEMRITWPDGTMHWIAAKGRFAYAESGRPTKMYGILMDITKRKQAESALQESEAKLRQAQQLAGIGYWERDLRSDSILWSEGVSEIFGRPLRSGFLTQAELLELVHPDDRQLQRDALSAALQGKRSYDVEYRLVRPDGNVRMVHVRDEVEYDEFGRPSRLFGTMQDITERKQAEEHIRRYAGRMEVLAAVSKALAECRQDVQAELDTIALHTAKLIGDGCVIALLSSDKRGFQGVAHHHRDSDISSMLGATLQRAPIIDADIPLAQEVLRTGEGLLVPELETEESKRFIDPVLRPFFHSLMTVPLRMDGQVIGILNLFRSTSGRPYTSEDQVLLQDLADRAALIIRNAQLFEQVAEARERSRALSRRLLNIQEEERRSLARELHDELGQHLTAIKFVFENARAKIHTDQQVSLLKDGSRLVDDLLQTVRSMALDMRPSILDEFGLPSALRWYVKRQAGAGGLDWSVREGFERCRYPTAIETACFRICQEAVTNVLKHAGAKHLFVELREDNNILHLYVRDDGKGFNAASALSVAKSGESLGIINMEERASLLGGALEIASVPGKGTEIHACLPLDMVGGKGQLEISKNEHD